ncbi:hypothetical protein Bhyg_06144 [Pseudolycoriella hygida]|uniref:Uncharacterized protein n=1 Tax=Pseudolycoriella hygida TaxID=35572 RepID=A0A9Q0N099_9DIPT|nr:hypothetical protein Bhyg_06144 [Pseudolycoriella hygida]
MDQNYSLELLKVYAHDIRKLRLESHIAEVTNPPLKKESLRLPLFVLILFSVHHNFHGVEEEDFVAISNETPDSLTLFRKSLDNYISYIPEFFQNVLIHMVFQIGVQRRKTNWKSLFYRRVCFHFSDRKTNNPTYNIAINISKEFKIFIWKRVNSNNSSSNILYEIINDKTTKSGKTVVNVDCLKYTNKFHSYNPERLTYRWLKSSVLLVTYDQMMIFMGTCKDCIIMFHSNKIKEIKIRRDMETLCGKNVQIFIATTTFWRRSSTTVFRDCFDDFGDCFDDCGLLYQIHFLNLLHATQPTCFASRFIPYMSYKQIVTAIGSPKGTWSGKTSCHAITCRKSIELTFLFYGEHQITCELTEHHLYTISFHFDYQRYTTNFRHVLKNITSQNQSFELLI